MKYVQNWEIFSFPSRWHCAGQTMALSWSLLLLFATLALSHSAEHGVPHGKRRQAQTSAGGSNALQYSSQGLQGHGYSRNRRGHGGQGARGAKGGAGMLSHRPLRPLARPEDDGTGLEGLSPVRLELGPGRDRVRMGVKSPSQVQENHLVGTRKERGHGHGHGHHSEHRRQGSRRDKGRHRKGELTMNPTHRRLHKYIMGMNGMVI